MAHFKFAGLIFALLVTHAAALPVARTNGRSIQPDSELNLVATRDYGKRAMVVNHIFKRGCSKGQLWDLFCGSSPRPASPQPQAQNQNQGWQQGGTVASGSGPAYPMNRMDLPPSRLSAANAKPSVKPWDRPNYMRPPTPPVGITSLPAPPRRRPERAQTMPSISSLSSITSGSSSSSHKTANEPPRDPRRNTFGLSREEGDIQFPGHSPSSSISSSISSGKLSTIAESSSGSTGSRSMKASNPRSGKKPGSQPLAKFGASLKQGLKNIMQKGKGISSRLVPQVPKKGAPAKVSQTKSPLKAKNNVKAPAQPVRPAQKKGPLTKKTPISRGKQQAKGRPGAARPKPVPKKAVRPVTRGSPKQKPSRPANRRPAPAPRPLKKGARK